MMKLIITIVGVLLILVSCGNQTKRVTPDYVTEWNLVQLYEDDPLGDSLRNVLLNTTVQFSHDTIAITVNNREYRAKFVREKDKTENFFGTWIHPLGSDYINLLKQYGYDISDSVSYIRFVDYFDSDYETDDKFSFDSYSLWQTLIVTDDFLCLPYDKSNVLLYQNNKKQMQNMKLTKQDTLPSWTYIITNNSVGLISMDYDISEIKQLLPPNYSVVDEKLSFDGDDEESLSDVFTIKNGKNVILYILFDEVHKDRVRSLIVLDPRYKLENTDISVGMLVGELLKQIKVKDVYFDIADGLYIIPENFAGSFKIDLKGRGDEYISLKDLPKDCCVEQIIVTNQD